MAWCWSQCGWVPGNIYTWWCPRGAGYRGWLFHPGVRCTLWLGILYPLVPAAPECGEKKHTEELQDLLFGKGATLQALRKQTFVSFVRKFNLKYSNSPWTIKHIILKLFWLLTPSELPFFQRVFSKSNRKANYSYNNCSYIPWQCTPWNQNVN